MSQLFSDSLGARCQVKLRLICLAISFRQTYCLYSHIIIMLTGMGILRIFPHLRIFFKVLPIFCISADFTVSSFLHSNQRERNAGKKCLQNNPNRASERNAENCSQKISLTEPQLWEPLTVSVMRSAHFHFANFRCFEWQQSCLGDAFSASMLFLVGGSEVA